MRLTAWPAYDPADPMASDLTAIDHSIGMWVRATAATVLPSDGTLPATTSIDLCEGWNLIGFPAAEPRHPYAALSSIAGKWERIFAYDAFDPEDPWEYFDPAIPDWANDLLLLQPGRGYWVLLTEDATLEIRNQGPPPTVAIASPTDLAVVTEPTEILGTILTFYRVYRVSRGDARIFYETMKNLSRGSDFATLLTELARAVDALVRGGGQIHPIGHYLGAVIFGSRRILFGIVQTPTGTMVVQVLREAGGKVVVHGPLT